MKKIKIKFVDFWDGFEKQPNDFLDVLKEKYDVEISDNPDYLFYSAFGFEHLKYDCIRIFYTGECITPNFNECDYAIGFDRLTFGDRYLRIPLYNIFQYRTEYFTLFNRKVFTSEDLHRKEGFCCFVVSNCFADDVRSVFFDKLSKYKLVSSGGRYKNNIGGAVVDKKDFQSKYKFAIAFENTSYNGYCTEKIMEAFVSGCIPIYYGDPEVKKDFNPVSFINVHDYNSFDDVIKRVEEIDNNDELYLKIRNANPILLQTTDNGLGGFLAHIINQEYAMAKRRPLSVSARSESSFKLRYAFFEQKVYKYFSKFRNQVIRFKTGTRLSKNRNK